MLANLQTAYAELTRAQFELQRRATEVEEARDLFERVVESMSEALFLTDRSGRILRTNGAARSLLEWQAEEALQGQPLADVLGTTTLPTTPAQIVEVSESGALTNLEAEVCTRAGASVPVSASCGLVRDARGKIIGTLVVVRNITERRRAETERARLYEAERQARKEAEAALRARNEFLSIASHELKTPVTGLRGFTQLLLRHIRRGTDVPPERLNRSLEAIEQQAERLVRLVDHLFDTSRIETGLLTLSRQPTDIVALAEIVVAVARMRTDRHTLVVHASSPQVTAWVDPLRLEQVVANLVDNAIKYSPDGGEIGVAVTTPDPATVHVTVTDRGLGVPPEKRDAIFDRFHRGHDEDHRSGLGLGLYISRQIVELHGGRIWVEFPEAGGSRFVVSLPIGSDAPTLEPDPSATPGAAHEGREAAGV